MVQAPHSLGENAEHWRAGHLPKEADPVTG